MKKPSVLAAMSHDLKNPMNSIIGFTSILLKEFPGPLNAEQKKQLGIIKTSADHLYALLNNVIDADKLLSHTMEVSFAPFDYKKSVLAIIEQFSPQAKTKDLKIKCNIAQDKIILNSDQRRVEQILENLLSNAIKFSNSGTIQINVKVGLSTVTTQVIDQGFGISQEHLEVVLNPNVLIVGSTKRPHEGTGLGLTICKKSINLLNGTFDVESELSKGSKFSFTLPDSN